MRNTILASIIIPTFNRCVLLEKTILSLVNQAFDHSKFEIIVIDNGSTDETKDVVSKYITKYPQHTIRYIYDDVPGLLTGRHRGAKEANSDIFCFIDDDIEASPGWLRAICDTFEDPNVCLIGGKCLPIYDAPPPAWEKSLWSINNDLRMCHYYSLIDQGNVPKDTDPNYIFGLNFCIRKEVLLNLGGFHPDCIPKRLQKYQGDGETGLTRIFAKKGFRAVYEPKALIYHHVPKERLTMEYLESRMFYDGVGYSYFLVRNHSKLMLALKLLQRAIKIRGKALLRRSKDELNERMENAYQNGFDFHQGEIKKDSRLIDWIKKENYFDYSLPA